MPGKHRVWATVCLVVALSSTALYLISPFHSSKRRPHLPPPLPAVEQMSNTITRVIPRGKSAQTVALLMPPEQLISAHDLQKLSLDASAELVQISVPQGTCEEQASSVAKALQELPNAPALLAGIGSGGGLAAQWVGAHHHSGARAVVMDGLMGPCMPAGAHAGKRLLLGSGVEAQPGQRLVQYLRSSVLSLASDDANEPMKVVEMPTPQPSDTVTIFYSGDGGWRDIDKQVGETMASLGNPVLGVDTLKYYWSFKSPEQSAEDLARLMAEYRQKWGVQHFVLAGYSFGADILPAIYNRLPAADQQSVDSMILLAFARTANFEIRIEGWLGTGEGNYQTGPELAKVPAEKVYCVYGLNEAKDSGCLGQPSVGEVVPLEGGHHFDSDYVALARRLGEAIAHRRGCGRRQLI
ncbi:Type IV secretory pathway, VirJ component [Pseudomonas sp. URIL14HWK12:I9]|uniref:virulence factor family protein n=2 Tax=unclassified Pseudomonas TaxID=196821 RepID=UPI000BD156EC|nr:MULTISPECIES: AcvB/VirJ family lysyl-phosphatidylglycerol hydrolase [unclassified Pseudomonas]PVZ19769.1 virulence protein VirJ [Pseudomonas sp. URIL14HWK12:I12]PVZ26835.1 virulence protein VirJ [Pseudomonas sp. URIL14HWK12:I10]PVZ37724.1 virulence protein VirJ [Pseudomonas sp. URIL14HWK12:I11]SNZ05921.1 Type IV secretory pathway, VirJ component [Pseudomonas sp. URIL14HWK12:I9]